MQIECGFHTEHEGSEKLILDGPTIAVIISFDPGMPLPGDGLASSFIPSMNVPALVDTGAQECYIDTSLAVTLQLPVVDRHVVAGSSGKHPADVYMAQITVPSLRIHMLGRFAGVRLIDGGGRHGALLGRTFLRRVTMSYDGIVGKVTITHPTP